MADMTTSAGSGWNEAAEAADRAQTRMGLAVARFTIGAMFVWRRMVHLQPDSALLFSAAPCRRSPAGVTSDAFRNQEKRRNRAW